MAVEAKILACNFNQNHVDKNTGGTTYKHVITYTNTAGEVKQMMVFAGDTMFNTLPQKQDI